MVEVEGVSRRQATRYRCGVQDARRLADTLAEALGASALELPTESKRSEFVVRLADGRVPTLIRDFGHAIGVCTWGSKTWSLRPSELDPALPELLARARTWTSSTPVDTLTLFELALTLCEWLAEAFGERWVASFPGVAQPSECWLHRANFDASSVGVFPGRVRLAIGPLDEDGFEARAATRVEFEAARPEILAAARRQADAYARNLELAATIDALAEALRVGLGDALGSACELRRWTRPTHESPGHVLVQAGARELVSVFAQADRVRVHAGLPGRDGWEAEVELDAIPWPAMLAALSVERASLTIDEIRVGHHYRVVASIQGLREGMVVRFVGFDDIDNHYGRYEFITRAGEAVAVSGDFSTLRNSPLGEAHRFLERIADPC